MKRRNFLKMLPGAGLTPFVVNGFSMRPFANSRIARMLGACDGIEERVLVLVQLKGGNDGLNMVIPVSNYDRYIDLRPTIAIPESGTGQYIRLDTTLPDEKQVGLHPAMAGIKYLYDKGWASLVQGAGYDNMNQSHFKGTDIWLSGGSTESYESGNLASGWMGRALQAFYPEVTGVPTPYMLDPLGIQIGDPNTSLGFHTETEHRNSINLSGQDPAGFYSLVQTIGGAPLLNVPDSDHGDELAYIMGIEGSVNLYAQRITEVFNAGSNAVSYPNNSFAGQLKSVARMIRGGCKTKIYLCQLNGFDTHGAQIVTGATSTGVHANLLQTLSDGLKTFFDDLEQLGIADQVLACTFSEFGRCAAENGSFGTDHGTLAPMFVFGKNVRPKVHGDNVDLDDLTTDYQLKNKRFDYRQVFATLLQDWLGANPYVMQEALFESMPKMLLVAKAFTVDADCYFGGSPVISDPFRPKFMTLSPNPAAASAELTFTSETEFEARLSLHSLGGRLVSVTAEQIFVGLNLFYFDVSALPSGPYFVRLENRDSGKAEVVKMIKQ